MSRTVAIDFGTKNMRMAVFEKDRPILIPNREGSLNTPCIVAFSKSGEILIGDAAKRQGAMNPERTITNVKWALGTAKTYEIDGRNYTPSEIVAYLFRKAKEDAEAYLKESVSSIVVSVPAHFADVQRRDLQHAIKSIGLDCKRMMNEGAAAFISKESNIGDIEEADEKIVEISIGHSACEVSVIETEDGGVEVLSVAASRNAGGAAFDRKVVEWLIHSFMVEAGMDLSTNPSAMYRLTEAAETAKIQLSSESDVHISLPYIASSGSGSLNLERTLSLSQFKSLTSDITQEIAKLISKSIKDSGVDMQDITCYHLSGAASKIPGIADAVAQFLGKPLLKEKSVETAVVSGAAVYSGVLTGLVSGLLVLDVTALSVSVETAGDVATQLIGRNTTIPRKGSEVFSTNTDNQSQVEFSIVQGELPKASQCIPVGRYRVDGIAPAPKGEPKIEVRVGIDQNGLIEVTAKDLAAGSEQHVSVLETSPLDIARYNAAVSGIENDIDSSESSTDRNPSSSEAASKDGQFDIGKFVSSYYKEKQQEGK